MTANHNSIHKALFSEVVLESSDVLSLKSLYGSSVAECLRKCLLMPILTFVLLSIITLIIFFFNWFTLQQMSIGDLISFLLLLLILSFSLYPFILYPVMRDFLHMKKIIHSKKKWRVIGSAAEYDIGVSLSEWGWNEKTMTFKGDGKSVSFELLDKEQDYVMNGGAFQIDFVYDRYHRAVELSRSRL